MQPNGQAASGSRSNTPSISGRVVLRQIFPFCSVVKVAKVADMDTLASGVYAIQNTVSHRQYVGSSQTVRCRWALHRSQLRRGVHHCKWLQRAWTKHGEECFRFVMLETAPIEALFERETFHMERCRAETGIYNSAPVAGTCRGVKLGPHSPEHRRKIGDAQRGKAVGEYSRRRASEVHKGKTISAAHRAAISAHLRTRVASAETRAKLSEAARAISEVTRAKRAASVAASYTPERREAASRNAANISDETRAKRAESVRRSWEKRRQDQAAKRSSSIAALTV